MTNNQRIAIWLFRSRMWREYAMAIKYDKPTMTGVGRDWCIRIGKMHFIECVWQAQHALQMARLARQTRKLAI